MGGAWLGRIPDVQHRLQLDSGMLGAVLLVAALGGLASLQLAPWLLRRLGHRRTLAVLAVPYPLAFLAIPLAGNAYMLAGALVLTGGLGSLVGVMANAHAADVERANERAIMSSFHAMYSIGSLAGAGAAGLMAGLRVPVMASIGGAAVVHFALIAGFISWLLRVAQASPGAVDASLDHLADHHHRRAWWRGVLLVGSLTFVAYMAESTVANWSTLFMRQERGAAPATAVVAFAAFSACMALGRLSGDALAMRFGKVAMVRNGALLAAAGLAIGLSTPSFYATVAGFALVGCGLSVLVPLLFSIAGNLRGGESHAAIARVGTIAYLGVLLGPAVIGAVAQRFSLQAALLMPAALLLGVAAGSFYIPQVMRRRSRARQVLAAAKSWLATARS
jgi:predicted MFS family arabinose efflux permease